MSRPRSDRTVRSEPRFGYEDLAGFISVMTGDEKHSHAATSTLDVIWTPYDRILDIDPDNPGAPDRDRFYLSKGHGPMAYYAVLTAKGFLEPRDRDRITRRSLLQVGSGSFGSPSS